MDIFKDRFSLSQTNFHWDKGRETLGMWPVRAEQGSPIPFLPFHAPKSRLFQRALMSCLAQELCFCSGHFAFFIWPLPWVKPGLKTKRAQPKGALCDLGNRDNQEWAGRNMNSLEPPVCPWTAHLKLPFPLLGWTNPESSNCEVTRRCAKNKTSGTEIQAVVENNLAVMFLHTLHISNGMALSLQRGFSPYHFHLVAEPEFVNHLHMCSVDFKSNYFCSSPNCCCIK